MDKRFSAMVRWSGVQVQGERYFSPEMTGYIGHKVEVRLIPDQNRVAIYTRPERKYLFDATLSTV